MKPPTITAIMVKWIPGGKNLYQILVTANNFDSRRHRIILRVNGKFYDNLKNYFTQNVILLPDSVTKKSALALPTEDLTIYAQLYDYQNNDIICTKKQEFGSMLLMWKERGRLENTVSDRFNFFWHKNKKVAKVEGPFDKEGKLQTEVKPGERYYFKALPNQQLHHTELLSVKWVYQYDGGEYSFFENHRIVTISGYNMMNTIFKNGPKKTKVYAYFVEKSERVMVEFSNTVQAEEAAEKQEEQQKEQDKPVTATGDICEFEARVRAFMRMLRYKEGTSNESGYTKLFSGKKFTDMRKHPEKVINAGGYKSSAAGAYQIMADTWKDLRGYFYDKEKDKWEYNKKKDYAKLYNIKSFDQESQDKFCLAIMKHGYTVDRPKGFYNPKIYIDKNKEKHDEKAERKAREWRKRFKGQQGDIIEMIIKGDIKRASLISSLCWSSLPDSPYGQQDPKYTFKDVKAIYEKYLKEELAGQSKELHLKKGFLKEFGYNDCGDTSTVANNINKYRIDIDKFAYSKTKENKKSKKYQYDIYEKGRLLKSIVLEKNEYSLLPFPETGINWDRFGTRDKGGDNWINEKVCAALLGFFYSLPKNGYTDKLYFNDISANNGRNIGHEGHNIAGNDIDIRYPGSSNGDKTIWQKAMKVYGTEAKFIKVLENILSVGIRWGFNKNYAYKKTIKHTTGVATSVHQDHFHIGLR